MDSMRIVDRTRGGGIGVIAAFCLVILLAGCRGRPELARLSADSVVVAFGDSLTAGVGGTANENYPELLAQFIGCRVINEGISGEESSEGRARLPLVLEQHAPDLVILCHGGNDMLHQRSEAAVRDNLSAMIAMVKTSGADVMLVGVPKPGLLLRVHRLYKELADANDIPLEADVLHDVLSTRSLKSDQIHPNAAGYRRMAEAVAALIHECARK
jgi:acyl-CoA thioesterase I